MSRGLPVVVPENAAEPLSAADFAGTERPSAGWWRPAHRRGELQGHVRPLAVVVGDVLGQQVVEVPRAEHDEVVEAFDLDALDEALDVGIEVWRPEWQLHGLDPGIGQRHAEARPP